MEDINSRANKETNSRVETQNNSQVNTDIDSQVKTVKHSRANKASPPPPVKSKPGRPRLYANKSEAMKAYRARVTKLQQESAEALDKLSTAILSDLLAKALRTLSVSVDAPSKSDADEARKMAGRIIKVLRARYTIRLG